MDLVGRTITDFNADISESGYADKADLYVGDKVIRFRTRDTILGARLRITEAETDHQPDEQERDQTIRVRFDAGGMGHWWGIFVGPVCVWSHAATEGPMSPDEREILSALVLWGKTEVAPGSEPEFHKSVAGFRGEGEHPYDPEVYYSMIGRPKVESAPICPQCGDPADGHYHRGGDIDAHE